MSHTDTVGVGVSVSVSVGGTSQPKQARIRFVILFWVFMAFIHSLSICGLYANCQPQIVSARLNF